jgi:hypothetical protein
MNVVNVTEVKYLLMCINTGTSVLSVYRRQEFCFVQHICCQGSSKTVTLKELANCFLTFSNTRYFYAYINSKKYGILHCIIIPEHYELYEIEK